MSAWTATHPTLCPYPVYEGAMAPMVVNGQHVVIFFGGEGPDGSVSGRFMSTETWMWDGSAWTRLQTATSPPALSAISMVYDSVHNNIVLFGGKNETGQQTDYTYTFDGSNWRDRTDRRPGAQTPPARSAAMMSSDVEDGGVLLFGGSMRSGLTDDLWLWNGTAWSQKQAPDANCDPAVKPCARWAGGMAPDPGTGGVVLFGGRNNSDNLADTWVWHNNGWTKRTPAHSPSPRAEFPFAALDAQTDILVGGHPFGVGDSAWAWDGTDWTSVAMAPGARFGAAMAALERAGQSPQLVVFGGGADNPQGGFPVYDDTWAYVPTAGAGGGGGGGGAASEWLQLQPDGAAGAGQPSGRNEAALATFVSSTGAHNAVLFGGAPTTGGSPLGDTWIWNGTAWSQLSFAGPTPPARSSAAMAWDPVTNTVVLFGGKDGSGPPNNLSDTWVFDPATTSWTQKTCATFNCSPSARRQAAMASDIPDLGVMLFGGTTSSGTLDDTWVWSGLDDHWIQKTAAGPPSRSEAVMGINPGDLGVVLFGGNHFAGGVTTILDDTWTWDGNAWTQRAPAQSPSPRYESAMASLDNVDVLFGGAPAGGGADLDDTWTWNGTDWTHVTPITSPPGRSHSVAAGAETSATDNTVNALLFGGPAAAADNDTWRFTP